MPDYQPDFGAYFHSGNMLAINAMMETDTTPRPTTQRSEQPMVGTRRNMNAPHIIAVIAAIAALILAICLRLWTL